MPPNINPDTGIAYGVIDARKCMGLYTEIMDNGVNETLTEAEASIRKRLTNNFSDFDAKEAFTKAGLPTEEKSDDDVTQEIWDKKEKLLTEWLSECIHASTELPKEAAALFADSAIDQVNVDSGTFDIKELVDDVVQQLYEDDYFNSDGEDSFTYEDGEFQYRLGYLGGAPLIWVIKSPYVTYCRTCSPCVPNAGSLDSCTHEGNGNNIAYCPEVSDIEADDDKPFDVRRVDAEGNIGEHIFHREEP